MLRPALRRVLDFKHRLAFGIASCLVGSSSSALRLVDVLTVVKDFEGFCILSVDETC